MRDGVFDLGFEITFDWTGMGGSMMRGTVVSLLPESSRKCRKQDQGGRRRLLEPLRPKTATNADSPQLT